ncbi:MAG: hypothetical protein J6O41_01775 [Clostridia bacterium]|nr:hypothetical protein [Clostridia bacterium]
MKKLGKIIIVLTCLIIIMIVVIMILRKKGTGTILPRKPIEEAEDVVVESEEKKLQVSEYLLAKNCVDQYINALTKDDSNYIVRDETGKFSVNFDEEEFKNNIYSILDENYIKENNITLQNLYDYINIYDNNVKAIPVEIVDLWKEDAKNIDSYKVKCIISEDTYERNNLGFEYYLVNICMANTTFSIRPIDEKVYNSDLQNIKLSDDKIEIKENNIYVLPDVRTQTESEEYFLLFRDLMLASPEDAFEKIDEEYREKRFQNLDKFKEYIDENRDRLSKANFTKYGITDNNGNTQYVCLDQNGFYYIFKQVSGDFNDYDVILDTYSIELKEFKDKYYNGDDQTKVGMNIQKVIEAINTKDYEYVFDKLDETFRNDKFENLDSFKKYIQDSLFEINTISSWDYNKEGKVHVGEIDIKNQEDEDFEQSVTIIMKLLDNSDFVMSFEIVE